MRTILPIGIFYSGSLVCSNVVYVYLSVPFIQMLKAAAPVSVLFTSWAFRVAEPNLNSFLNVLWIVAGVALASAGEIQFSIIGFMYQMGGIVFESIRIIMIQVLLSNDGMKMDPLVGLYYFAPVCAFMNFIVALPSELPNFTFERASEVGYWILLLNATIAFLLNVTSVFLVSLVAGLCVASLLTQNVDWKDLWPRHDPDRHLQKHSSHHSVDTHLEHQNHLPPDYWLHDCSCWLDLLFARIRSDHEAVEFGRVLARRHGEFLGAYRTQCLGPTMHYRLRRYLWRPVRLRGGHGALRPIDAGQVPTACVVWYRLE